MNNRWGHCRQQPELGRPAGWFAPGLCLRIKGPGRVPRCLGGGGGAQGPRLDAQQLGDWRGVVSRGQSPGAGICRWRGAGRSRWRPGLPGSRAWGHLPGSPVAGVWTGQLHRPDSRGGWRRGWGQGGWKCPAWVWHPHRSGGRFLGPSLGFSPATAGRWWMQGAQPTAAHAPLRPSKTKVTTPPTVGAGLSYRPEAGPGASPECLMPLGMDGPPRGHLPGEVEPSAQPCGCSTTCWRVSG